MKKRNVDTMKKRNFVSYWWAFAILLFLLVVYSPSAVAQKPFVHPGGLHDRADLDRMKAKVAAKASPWIEDWERLSADPLAQHTFQPSPQANMGVSRQRASRDAHAAYLNAVRWYISGDTRYADCAIRICNAWSQTVDQPPTGRDIPGLSAIPTTEFALVGELLRICPRWKAEDFSRFKNMLRTYWYPAVHQFLTEQNGPGNTRYWANWNIANIGACIAIGVLCDDRAIFDEGVSYFKSDQGTGSIKNAVYFVHPGDLGQWQESGRDQPHAILGVGLMAQFCEVAWKQGIDLYGIEGNRLLKGAEYVARWNLGKPVPYKHYTNSDNANQSWISINGRGRLHMPVWEMLYNHYAVRKGLPTPNVQSMARLMRPEGGGLDHFGYGTLMFTLDAVRSPYLPAAIPPPPTALSATAGVGRVFLTWAGSGDDTAQGYEVRRASTIGGPYESIASWTDNTLCEHVDTKVTPGTTYYYVVAARNRDALSCNSAPASAIPAATGALPTGWTLSGLGTVSGTEAGFADVSGGAFVVSGSGAGIGGTSDGLTYVQRTVTGDATITARLADATWRGGRMQRIGIMMRASLAPDAPALVMKLGDLGVRQAGFGTRDSVGGVMSWVGGNDYTWLPAWFRLERVGNVFTAYESSDGVRWFPVGRSIIPMAGTYLLGLAVSSDGEKSNTAYFDHVAVMVHAPVVGAPRVKVTR